MGPNTVIGKKSETSSVSRLYGFTLIELLVVLMVLSLLVGLAAPVVSTAITRSKEAALKSNLSTTRQALDDFFADRGYYPEGLDVLVSEQYLRSMPYDPIVKSSEMWSLEEEDINDTYGVVNLRSSSNELASDGSYYSEW
jgi:general secretion pathway protein G